MDSLLTQENKIQLFWRKMFENGLRDLLVNGSPEQRKSIVDQLMRMVVRQVEHVGVIAPTATMVSFRELLHGDYKELAEIRKGLLPDLSIPGNENRKRSDMLETIQVAASKALAECASARLVLTHEEMVTGLLELAGVLAMRLEARPEKYESFLGQEFQYSQLIRYPSAYA